MKRRTILQALGLSPLFMGARRADPSNELIGRLKKRWENSRAYTLAVLEAMPEIFLEFSPTRDQLTFAQHLIHLGFFNNMFLGLILDPADLMKTEVLFTADYLLERPDAIALFEPAKLGRRPGSTNKALVRAYLERTFDFSIGVLEKLDDPMLAEEKATGKPWLFAGHSHLDLILRGENHTAHHRGQAIAYLRMKEVTPPSYAAFNAL